MGIRRTQVALEVVEFAEQIHSPSMTPNQIVSSNYSTCITFVLSMYRFV